MGLLAYVLVLFPVVIGRSKRWGLKALTAHLTAMLTEFPLLFFAAVVLAVSYVVARLVADLATAFLAAIGIDGLPARLGLTRMVLEGAGGTVGTLQRGVIVDFDAVDPCQAQHPRRDMAVDEGRSPDVGR